MAEETGNNNLPNLPLGRDVSYPGEYDASLLCPIPRHLSRVELGIEVGASPFFGEDIWNAYELSWLNSRGKPMVAEAEFRFAADTPAIIESKSFKLYLNSLNQTRFDSRQALVARMAEDLSAAAGGPVAVVLTESGAESVAQLPGLCLDALDIDVDSYAFNPDTLAASGEPVEESLHSHLLRSLCPVTGQPDWGSVLVHYRGPAINREGLLRYIISYRQHQEFHEQCVERIYRDIQSRCQPQSLLVCARYLRRGGLDINPYRSSEPVNYPNLRLGRQ